MYEIDIARGLAYQGNEGFVIQVEPKGLYIINRLKKVFLTQNNSKIMEVKDGTVKVQRLSQII